MIDLAREKKVISMMITAHSILSERYQRFSSFFEITLLVSSAILNALVFVDGIFVSQITGINIETQRVIIGIASVIVFAISIVLLQVHWKEKAQSHLKSADELFLLLQECRSILTMQESQVKNNLMQEFNIKYAQVNTGIAKIPHRSFNSLKLAHYRKVELSKLIDKHPGSLLFILKLKLFLSSLKKDNDLR